jgi:hypothetical protein
LDHSKKAVAVYEGLVARYGEAPEPEIREIVAMAMLNKGVRLSVLRRSEEAVAAFEEVVVRFGDASEPELCEQVANARRALAVLKGEAG